MAEQSIKNLAHERFIRMLLDKTSNEKQTIISKQTLHSKSDPFPYAMLVTLISSILLVVFIVGLAVTRYYTYYNRRKNESKDSSYSVSRYWRRQLASASFDSIVSSPPMKSHSTNSKAVNEKSRIIKSSFSWPEATILHQQQQQQEQEKGECSSTISSSSLSNSSTMEQMLESASLTFALRYDEITTSLFVRIMNARDLFVHRRNRQSSLIDSYVRVELLSNESDTLQESLQSMRTHIIKKNTDPIYDELFEFTNLLLTKKFSLLFTILTYDTFTRDEILGQVEFPIHLPDVLETTETIFTRDITPRHKQLCNQQLGQMLISLCYQPFDSTITLIVLKASNLPRIGATRLINPYFKIYMFYKGQRIIKKRSTIKRTTQCPVYNECFTFHIPDNDLENIHFDIVLFDYDRHMKHEPIGTFSVGNHTNEKNQHWTDVCQRQISKQIAQWYQLKPFRLLD